MKAQFSSDKCEHGNADFLFETMDTQEKERKKEIRQGEQPRTLYLHPQQLLKIDFNAGQTRT